MATRTKGKPKKKPAPAKTVSLGSLYDLNKEAMRTQDPLPAEEVKKALRNGVKSFFLGNKDQYFMLLCREKYDFTLFNLKYKEQFGLMNILSDLQECLDNRGEVLSIEKNQNNAYEIWIRDFEEPKDSYVYYLFPYDLGVIEEQ